MCALKATADMFLFVSASVIEKSSYMDDVVSGAHKLKESKDLSLKIECISKNGGFKFKKFIFSTEREENFDENPAEKVFGVAETHHRYFEGFSWPQS